MVKLPRLSGKEVMFFMVKETTQEKIPTVVPMHKEIDTGTLLEIIRQSKMTRDEFLSFILKKRRFN